MLLLGARKCEAVGPLRSTRLPYLHSWIQSDEAEGRVKQHSVPPADFCKAPVRSESGPHAHPCQEALTWQHLLAPLWRVLRPQEGRFLQVGLP